MVPHDDGIAPVTGIPVDRPVPSGPGLSENARQGGPAVKVAADAGSDQDTTPMGEGLRLQLQAQNQDARITFQKDEDSGELVVQLKDSSGKVLRQIPPDEMLRLAKAIDQYLGLLVDRHS